MFNQPKELAFNYDIKSRHRLVVSTGAVTTIAARTATAGQLLAFRWSSSTAVKCFVRRIGAKFTLTTAYGAAQETGCDVILAHAYTANASAATAVDVGSTVPDTGVLQSDMGTSLITVNSVRVADTGAITAGTHTLDANPFGVLSDWSAAIGDTVPRSTSGAASSFGNLWDYRESAHGAPFMLTTDQGFVIRNLILMGATGVGRWDFLVEWDEGTPQP